MSQILFSFRCKAPLQKTKREYKRYQIERTVIQRIRKGLGQAIVDLSSTGGAFNQLVGRAKALTDKKFDRLPTIQNAAAISKWMAQLKANEAASEAVGTVQLLLDSPLGVAETTITSLIIQAALKQQITLIALPVEQKKIDYEMVDQAQQYAINLFVPRASKNINRGMQARWQTDYPFRNTPQDNERLGGSVGKALKRHLIESAQHHSLNVKALEESIFLVRARWITRPTTQKNRDEPVMEALSVIFSVPISFNGYWFAGSSRHVGAGQITSASPNQSQQIIRSGGSFIL